jgi:hypothetical protein
MCLAVIAGTFFYKYPGYVYTGKTISGENMKKIFLFMSLAIIALFGFTGCSNSTDPATAGTLSLSSKYQTSILAKTGYMAGFDSIKITKATFLLREIKFKTLSDSSEGLYKTTPLIFELNLTGSIQNVGELTVPFGSYNKLEYDIHKAEASDTTGMAAEQRVKMRAFFAGVNKYSIIIEGQTYTGGAATNFVYKSSLNVKQKITLSAPLVITESEPTHNGTMIFSSFGWFLENGTFLDPSDSRNFTKIDNNIRESIRAIKDKNKDGNEG